LAKLTALGNIRVLGIKTLDGRALDGRTLNIIFFDTAHSNKRWVIAWEWRHKANRAITHHPVSLIAELLNRSQ